MTSEAQDLLDRIGFYGEYTDFNGARGELVLSFEMADQMGAFLKNPRPEEIRREDPLREIIGEMGMHVDVLKPSRNLFFRAC